MTSAVHEQYEVGGVLLREVALAGASLDLQEKEEAQRFLVIRHWRPKGSQGNLFQHLWIQRRTRTNGSQSEIPADQKQVRRPYDIIHSHKCYHRIAGIGTENLLISRDSLKM